MSTETALAYFVAHAPAPTATVSPALLRAREALDAAGRELVAVPDGTLDREWQWEGRRASVRFGLLRSVELVDVAAGSIEAILADFGTRRSNAALRIAPSTAARWDLHGRLVALDEGSLDRAAKEGEWTIRETLGHIVGGQRGYATFATWHWYRNSAAAPTEAELAQIQADTELPEDAEEGVGSIAEIRARFDDTVDRGAAHLAAWTDDDLARPARWSGMPIDVAFRIGRWASHITEHTIQIDKTLAWLDHQPSEAERIVGELYRAWGRLEAQIFPIEPAVISRVDSGGRSIESVLGTLGETLVSEARSVRAAAEG